MSEAVPVVHLIDDDTSFLTATARLLRASGLRVKAFDSAQSFLEYLHAEVFGCVVVDLNMPGMTGPDLQAALGEAGCALPIIFLTGQGDIPTTVRAIRSGAEDYLEKRVPKEQLLAAIGRAVDRNAREQAEHSRLRETRARFNSLSDREREVFEHVVQGKLNKQIAADLGIHERTVKLHRTAITTKLRLPSVAELTVLAHQVGVIPNQGT